MGCRRKAPPGELVRLAAGPDGGVRVGGAGGRGAWLCAGSASCARNAARSGALVRALRVTLGRDVLERLASDAVGDGEDPAVDVRG